MIIAQPKVQSVTSGSLTVETRTVEPGLQCGMLARTALTIVVVYDKSPRLLAGLEALGDIRDGVRFRLAGCMIVVECDINVATFVVYSLKKGQLGYNEMALSTNSDH